MNILPKKLLVVLPVYNEAVDLPVNAPKVYRFLAENFSSMDWLLVIAEQASVDKTLDIAKNLSHSLPRVRVVHSKIKGRGGILKKVWSESDADYVSYMDIDLSSRLEYFPKLIAALESGADIAIGSRLNKLSVVTNRTFFRETASRLFNRFLSVLLGITFEDAQCGFKALKKSSFDKLSPHIKNSGWIFDTELLVIAEKAGLEINVVPIAWDDDPGTTVKIWRYALEGLQESFRLFFTRPWRHVRRK